MIKIIIKRVSLFLDWVFENTIGSKRIIGHAKEFPYIWALLILLLIIAIISPYKWGISSKLLGALLVLIIAQLLILPMNAVYGLMGTSGSIRLFFVNFILITLLFAGVYYGAFFKDAGVSYDINQPHIDYQLYSGKPKVNIAKVSENRDTLFFERQIDTISFKESIINVTRDTIHYQPISFVQVWRSSILTTLTQEPAELLTAASVNNAGMDSSDLIIDKQKSDLFEWILIFHIIISWIFFGVFISLLYNKFRYES